MADDIGPQKNIIHRAAASLPYNLHWIEGYKTGARGLSLPDHYAPRYLAGYEKGKMHAAQLRGSAAANSTMFRNHHLSLVRLVFIIHGEACNGG